MDDIFTHLLKGSMNNNFFEKSKESSLVKSRIVEKYFKAWVDIIVRHAISGNTNIGYVDLFAGPGIYEDGSKSTPIQILEQALKNKDICDRLMSVFNDVFKTMDQAKQHHFQILTKRSERLLEFNLLIMKSLYNTSQFYLSILDLNYLYENTLCKCR